MDGIKIAGLENTVKLLSHIYILLINKLKVINFTNDNLEYFDLGVFLMPL
jgi:hypothetical protein